MILERNRALGVLYMEDETSLRSTYQPARISPRAATPASHFPVCDTYVHVAFVSLAIPGRDVYLIFEISDFLDGGFASPSPEVFGLGQRRTSAESLLPLSGNAALPISL
jgi:hypothetical protein